MRLSRVRRLLQQGLNALTRGQHSQRKTRLLPRCPVLEALEDRTLLTVSMVADLTTAPQSSSPQTFVQASGTMFFFAYDPVHGQELWKTDGTTAGTTLVKDIYPTWAGAVSPIDEGSMVALNGDVYFMARDPINGRQLWKSDGTAAGTVPVLGMPTTVAFGLTSIDGALYFEGDDSSGRLQLWTSDGTAAGTAQLTAVTSSFGLNSGLYLTDLNGSVYFLTDSNDGGGELWKSDGTPGGTVMVSAFGQGTPGTGLPQPAYLTNVNGTLFFVADDGPGTELWKSDGTTAGTSEVTLIRQGPGGLTAYELTAFDGSLYFVANDGVNGNQLWQSDGTAAGTAIVPITGPNGPYNDGPSGLTVLGNSLYFVDHSESSTTGVGYSDLWITNGTQAGTGLVQSFATADGPGDLAAVGTTLFSITLRAFGRPMVRPRTR